MQTMCPLAYRRPARPPSHSELQGLDDEELMASLKAGRSDALAVLFDRYHRRVLSIALKIVRDSGEAEEVIQNVFLEIFRAVAQFDPSKGSPKVLLAERTPSRKYAVEDRILAICDHGHIRLHGSVFIYSLCHVFRPGDSQVFGKERNIGHASFYRSHC